MYRAFFRCLSFLSVFSLVSATSADTCATSCPSGSGPIKVFRVTGSSLTLLSCHAADTDFAIDASGLSGSVSLLITDCASTTPTNNIGRVSIDGASATLTSLLILVVGSGQNLSVVSNNLEPLDRACINFGGLIVTDSATRAKTRTSISVTGTIQHRGSSDDTDVHVNQVVRVQSDDAIDANLIATGTGTLVGTTSNTIGQIRAGDAIRGRVEASNGDIFAIRVLNVSPLPAAEGISGSIFAKGNIGTIFSTGPIGGSGSLIRSGGKIEQIRTVSESSPGAVLSADMFSVVETGVDLDGTVLSDTLLTGVASSDAPVGLIDVGGDMQGNHSISNLAAPAGQN